MLTEISLLTYCSNFFGSLWNPVVLCLVSIAVGICVLFLPNNTAANDNNTELKSADKHTWYFFALAFITIVLLLFIPKGGILSIVRNFPVDAKFSDIIPTIQVMCERFVQGINPYQEIDFGYKLPPSYMPLVWLPYVPAEILHIDYRWTMIFIFFTSILFLFYKNIRKNNGIVYNSMSLLLVAFFLIAMVDKEAATLGWTTELLNASFYILLIIALLSNNILLKAIAIAVCLLSRYSILFFVPLIFFIEYVQYGKRNSLLLMLYAAVIFCAVLLIFANKNILTLYEGYKYYSTSGLGEWNHLNDSGLPLHVFSGNGFASWIYTYKTGSIEEKFAFMKKIQQLIVLLTVVLLTVVYWFKRKTLQNKFYLLGAVKIYFAIFYGFMQVPYTYLFMIPLLCSIAIFFVLNKNIQKAITT